MTRTAWHWSVLALLAGVVLYRCVIAVDETEHVLVTRFGKHVVTYSEPGLRLVMPYHSVIRFDKRLQVYDPLPSEFLTSDPKNILLDIYVCWRVRDPLLFLQRVTDQAGAEVRIHDVVWAEVAADIGRRPMSALVSDQPGEAQRTDILGEIRARCAQRTEASFGIELVDVRLKRISLPEQNKQSVFRRMRAERDRIARKYRAEGEEEAMKIKAAADRERSQLLAEAERDAALRRGAAAKEAIRIYAVAHGKDPEFYRFLRSLEAYRAILDRDTTLVLSSDSALFRYLSDPAPAGSAGTTSATAESATPGR